VSLFLKRLCTTLSLCVVLVSPALAVTPKTYNPKINVGPQVRITDKIDNTKLTPVANSHAPVVDGLADMGRLPASTQLSHMMLVLKPTDEQEYALHTLLDEQQDKTHANYHQWMTPDTFGAYFGVAPADIATVSGWLQDSGFTVNSVAKGGRIITFSGTSGQVEAAFHTEMHQYMINGVVHSSNSKDISIPTALSQVVVGPNRLNDFNPHSDAKAFKVTVDGKGNVTSSVPFGSNTSFPTSTNFPSGHFVGGSDLATIYDTNPLFAKGIQGQGVTLGIIGQTDVLLSDIQVYRSIYGLPINNYQRIQVGTDPGIIPDDTESDLDLEVSGAMAPLANQIFYTSGNSYYGGGVDSAVEYVIEDNAADIFSMSYGECEYDLGTDNAFFAYVYEQGAAQGQSFFISTGDDGPDTCGGYYSTTSTANQNMGYSVNGLGSTPYNVAVGGTQFNEGTSYNTPGATQYWSTYNTAAPYESALSFVPDQPWNESIYGTGTYGGLTGGGSGVSLYYQRPSWQVGPGVPTGDPTPPAGSYEAVIPATNFQVAGPHRLLPDVSLNASVYHDGTVLCSEGSCTLNANGSLAGFGIVGGTSVASPTMAGAQALINQMNGGRQGNPNYYYYQAALKQSVTACVASNYVATAGCSFHDSQAGNTDVPATRTASLTNVQEIGWNTGVGYDMAVGLDSPDVSNLATIWSAINFNATTTAFTITPVTGGTPGGNYNVTVTVKPVSGTGTPTGDVGIIAQALYGGLGWVTLSGGTGSGTFTGLPAGTYCIYAHYEGDTVYGGSNSPCVSITVAQALPTVVAQSDSLVGTALTPTASFAYGTNVYINMGILPPGSGFGVPTGTLTVNLNNGAALTPYSTGVDPNGTYIGTQFYPGGGYFDAGLGLTTYDIASTYPVLAPGTYTAAISYSGDSTFKTASAAPITFVVGPVTQTIKLTASTPDITTGGNAVLVATIATIDPTVGGVPAAGTVTFTDTTTAKTLGTGTMANGTLTFTTTGITQTGANSITATFAGSVYYNAVTSTAATVTVGTGTTTTTTVTPLATTYQVLSTVPLVATVATATSGTVTFFDSGISIGTATVGAANTATLNYGTFTAGTHVITATYGGTATLQSSTSSAVNLVIGKNTPSLNLSAQTSGNSGVGGYAMSGLLTLSPAVAKAAVPAPTGNIQFLDAANGAAAKVLGTAVPTYLPNYEDYDAVFTTTALAPGNHVLSETYPGDSNYAAANSNTLSVAIGLTTMSVSTSTSNIIAGVPFTLSANVVPVQASITQITGPVTFYDGTVATGLLLGTANVTNGKASLPLTVLSGSGSHTITAVYAGDTNYYTVTSTDPVTVAKDPTTIVLTTSTTNVGTNIPFTLTATITGVPASTLTIGGTVTFYDGTVAGGVVIGGAAVPVTNGVATLTTATLTTVGTHTITAVYTDTVDTNFASSTTVGSFSITSVTPGYTIAVIPTSATLPHTGSVTVTVTATSFGNYAGIGSLSCSGLPANSFCPYNAYQQFTFSGVNGTQTTTLTITAINAQGTSNPVHAGLVWIPAMLMAGLLFFGRKRLTLRGRQLMLLAVLFCGMMAVNGCSGGNDYSKYPTPLGPYTVTLTSIGAGATAAMPAVTATATLALTVD